MKVTRENRSLSGMGCSCQDPSLGMSGLGMNNYSDLSWGPPSQSAPGGYFGQGSVNQPGTAANALANAQPDGATPVGDAVFDAFTNDNGGSQPGVLALNPNATSNNLSFVQPPVVSTQCEVVNAINANPIWLLAGTAALFYFASYGAAKHRERKARKAAK